MLPKLHIKVFGTSSIDLLFYLNYSLLLSMNTLIKYSAVFLAFTVLSLFGATNIKSQVMYANPTSLTFISPGIGVATDSQCFVFTNNSNALDGIYNITLGGSNPDDFQLSGGYVLGSGQTILIPAHSSYTVCVFFKPLSAGQSNAIITFKLGSHSLLGPYDLELHGSTGVQVLGNPRIVIMPNLLNFDSVALGDSLCKSLTVSNPGTDTLLIKKQVVTSSEGDFNFTFIPQELTAIPPSQSRMITVCFKPRQAGAREARITFFTNIPVTAQGDTGTKSVSVAGTGVPHGALFITSPKRDSAIIGSTICQIDTLWNSGEADLLVNTMNISGTNSSEFALNNVILPFQIKAKSKVTLKVCATPSARGLRNAVLSATAKSNERTLTASIPISIFGKTICSSVDSISLFANQKVIKNTDSSLCIRVTNCGDVSANYTVRITDTTYYSFSPLGANGVLPGNSTVFCVKFNPRITGVLRSKLIISTNDLPDMIVDLLGSGACAAIAASEFIIPNINAGGHGTFKVTLRNTGNLDWNPGTPLLNPNNGIYALTGAVPVIPSGDSIQLLFRYDPENTNQMYSTQVSFPNSGPCSESPLTFLLSQQTGTAGVNRITEQGGFALGQNYPNPASGITSFDFTIPKESSVSLSVFDMSGNEVQKLITGRISEGIHSVTFDGTHLSAGTYLYLLESSGIRLSRYFILVK